MHLEEKCGKSRDQPYMISQSQLNITEACCKQAGSWQCQITMICVFLIQYGQPWWEEGSTIRFYQYPLPFPLYPSIHISINQLINHLSSRLHAQWGAQHRAWTHNPEIQDPELRPRVRRLTDWAIQLLSQFLFKYLQGALWTIYNLLGLEIMGIIIPKNSNKNYYNCISFQIEQKENLFSSHGGQARGTQGFISNQQTPHFLSLERVSQRDKVAC